jgi:hypothetical protein
LKNKLLVALITAFSLLCLSTNAQRSANKNFKEIQGAFYRNFNGNPGEYDEGSSFNQFRRWESFWGPRLMPEYDLSKAVTHQRTFLHEFKTKKRASERLKSNWEELGPNKNGLGGTGRIDAIAFHPTDTNTIYVGAPSGGAWVSHNAGENWENLNTDFQLPFIGVSSIAIDPQSPDIIFLGTGDVDSEWTYSTGVYRSGDAGQNWQPAGLNNLDTAFTIGKILLHPLNQNVAFAATSLGIFKTSNRNSTSPAWEKVYPQPAIQFEYFRNMFFHADDPEILFASGINIITSSQSGTAGSWESIAIPGSGLDFTNTPWPDQFIGEEYLQACNMAVAPQGDFLYINCLTRDTPPPYNWQSASYFHFFRYDIENKNWAELTTSGLFGDNSGPGITGGRTEMTVSPVNSSLLYCGGVRPYVLDCSNPENTWKSLHLNAHVDYHELVFSPWEENVLYVGTDGGLFKKDLLVSQAFTDGGQFKWSVNQRVFYGISNGNPTIELNNGLGLATIYNLGSSPVDPEQILLGCQDLGIFYRSGSKWYSEINNADGFQCLMDKDDQNLMYATVPYPKNGTLFRSDESFMNPAWEITMTGLSPVNESSWFGASLVADPADNKTLFQARLNLWKVDDASLAEPSDWYKITDIGNITPPGWNNNNCAIYALEIAPTNPDYLYFSAVRLDNWVTEYDAVRIFRTSTGGGLNACDWNDITPPTPGNTKGTYFVTDIAVNSQNPEKIWVSYSGYLENYKVKMFDGDTWSDLNEGLPNLPVNCLVHVNGSDDALFAGTDAGVYFRDASTDQWEPYSENLPAVIVNWLEVNYTGQKLRAGTFGRGLWETSLPVKIFNTGLAEHHDPVAEIFPNPTTGNFTIISPTLHINRVTIHNSAGQLLLERFFEKQKNVAIGLSRRPKGIYFLTIHTDRGMITKKLVMK